MGEQAKAIRRYGVIGMIRFSHLIMAACITLSGYCGVQSGETTSHKLHSLLPPPPVMTSELGKRDVFIYQNTRHLIGTARWKQAIHDARVGYDGTIEDFLQAGHISLTPVDHIKLIHRLKIVQQMARHHMTVEKNIWKRRRPFVDYGGRSCVVGRRRFFPSWSYPSGHTVRAYSIALTLSDMFPAHRTELLQKAHDFSESRIICGMHWQSDVEAGTQLAYLIFEAQEEMKREFLRSNKYIQ